MTQLLRPTRRQILRGAAALASAAMLPGVIGCAAPGPRWSRDPFSLGVASGDPVPDGFVLWTRLAPEPLSPDPATPGGMSGGAVPVAYEIASDPGMTQILRSGTALAAPEDGWSVHLEIAGLPPGRPYWYRFAAGTAQSRIGRTMTAPAAGAPLDKFRFGFVSCSNYEVGYFSAYRHLAEEHPDIVIFLGDYIYEFAGRRRPSLRQHSDGVAATDLRTYRNRYAQYHTDPDLQILHASVPALMTWDDHEVQNDYANDLSETFDDPAKFLRRRAAAYRAFYEHMPVRPSLSYPHGPDMRVYDRSAFGDLIEFSVLDGRQYRSRQACYAPPDNGGGHPESNASCPERLDPARSFLGVEQERWLYDGLARSRARWNVIAQDQLMAELRERQANDDIGYWTDDWNGYPAARARLLHHIQESRVGNPVVIGGDIHSFWANELRIDNSDRRAAPVATEFVGTSITSFGPPYDAFMKFLPDNPHVKFFESRKRGYVLVETDRQRMEVKMQVISDASDPKATLSTLKRWTVENGRAGPQAA